MKILLARFGLFLIMMAGIAGSTLVEGSPADARVDARICANESAAIATASVGATQQRTGTSTARAVRWQSLLPGAFR
jgi:hypothetical protein